MFWHGKRAWIAPREDNVDKKDRGFASMDRVKQREVASMGGKASHQKGGAHQWTSEEARDAGRKSGKSRRDRSVAKKGAVNSVAAGDGGWAGDEDLGGDAA